MAYATQSDLLERHDARTLGDYVDDTGTRQTTGQLASNSVLASMLADASGEIDAALLRGSRYSAADLSGLTGNSLALLKRITCDIAVSLLLERRPGLNPELADKYHQRAWRHLEQLRKGEYLFDLTAQQAKTHPTVDGPTSVDLQKLNLITARADRYYPDPGSRLPIGRG